jgi:hypothetical protein
VSIARNLTFDRRLHLLLAIGLALTILWGFWPSYFGFLARGDVARRPWVIHVHAAVFVAWIVLVVVQASLVTGGRVLTHRRLGVAAATYGALVFAVGLFISVAAPRLRVAAGQMKPAQASLVTLYNLTDVLLFGAFLAAALLHRNRADLHRRLMLSATVALAGAAVGRVIPGDSPWYLVVWLWPLLVLIAVELWTRRRLHVVSLLSVALFVLASFKVQIFSLL